MEPRTKYFYILTLREPVSTKSIPHGSFRNALSALRDAGLEVEDNWFRSEPKHMQSITITQEIKPRIDELKAVVDPFGVEIEEDTEPLAGPLG